MKKYVLDTSVLVKWFEAEENSFEAKEWLKLLERGEIEIILPELVKYELANALLKGKKLSFPKARIALEVFYHLPLIFRTEDYQLSCLSYSLAEKLKVTYYDACFLALAKEQKATLVTANPKHQRKIRGIKVVCL